ncbi:MAG: putative exported protein [Cyanobacteria bacterium RYN_339]|nr:putative exported protein [Cyanobacteria bacterium RYN_339]
MRLPIVLVASLLIVACGTLPTPTARQAVAPQALALEGETDLAPASTRAPMVRQALQREGTKANDALVFKTVQTGAIKTVRKDGVELAGALSFPDFDGKPVAAHHATVHVQTQGMFGMAKEVGRAETDATGHWAVALDKDLVGKQVDVVYELGNERWTIGNYRWAGPKLTLAAGATDTGAQALDPASQNGQAGLIHLIWNRALGEFERDHIDLGWWRAKIKTNWPASGNFYNFGAVNLTDAPWWDVNGHEIGHAMFFAAFDSASGAGEHYIDKCYAGSLAWSEGFGSFFSGVISLPRDDQDAKFEFMVPRRKPIRLENVPTDVCEGYTNEWRVCAAMWDVYDTHSDGSDHVAVDFKTIWDALAKHDGTKMNDVRDAFARVAGTQPAAGRPDLAAAFGQAGVSVTR